MIYLGTAGWSIPREAKHLFPVEGSHLERYATHFNAVEINSSFYRPHWPATYERWARTVPADFRFSLKLPKLITHKKRLVEVENDLEEFLSQATSLGSKLGPVLIQLPPSFQFDASVVPAFFELLRSRFQGSVVLEPRHATWFTPEVEELLVGYRIARAMADPAPVPEAARPGGWTALRYYRLHGSPRIYYSPYEDQYLDGVAGWLGQETVERWCIFDNTALGFAAGDALRLKQKLTTPDDRAASAATG
jgi:uncharacterized protein YecE (DUF72 family)